MIIEIQQALMILCLKLKNKQQTKDEQTMQRKRNSFTFVMQ